MIKKLVGYTAFTAIAFALATVFIIGTTEPAWACQVGSCIECYDLCPAGSGCNPALPCVANYSQLGVGEVCCGTPTWNCQGICRQ